MNKINWINGQAGGTPLSAENLNQMQDNIEDAIDDVDEKFNYSTEEKVVGTWIDGKPIYECVLTVGSVTAGSVGHVPFSRTNIDEILDCQGFGRDNNNNWFLLSRAHPSQFKYQIGIYYNYPDNEFSIEMGTEINISKGYIIVRYTKTTD